ncbi:MAG: dephospho-CoA kinase [Planctomycetota bacterium]|jgi:dephospho-CoA kinase
MTDVVGVIGGIGCGKSAVSAAFGRLGAQVLDADTLAHDVLELSETKIALRREFGDEIFDETGSLKRRDLADLVFGPKKKDALERLNQIVHPAVRIELDRGLEKARREAVPMVILDIPLLMNSRFKDECDHIIFVDVSRETRLTRVKSRKWSAEELDRRESSQLSLVEKKTAATLIIENECSIEELELNVKTLYDQIVGS